MAQTKRSFGLFLSLFILIVLIVGSLAFFSYRSLMNPGGAHSTGLRRSSRHQVAVLDLKGIIFDHTSKKFSEVIDEILEDSSIQGVLVRVNSPGGVVAPSQEVFEILKELNAKKPVYITMGSVAASGGYYVACAGRRIYADPGTITGSIGVIMQFLDLSKLYQWAKVSPYNVKTGRFKDLGSSDREMAKEEKELIQAMIDNVLAQFRRAVAESRKIPYEKVVELSDGRIYSGEQAKTLGLVDELGGFRDALAGLSKELKLKEKPTLVYPQYNHRGGLLERILLGDQQEEDSESHYGGGPLSALFLKQLLGVGGGTPALESGVSRLPMYLLHL